MKTDSCSNCHEACETCFGSEANQCIIFKESFLNTRNLASFQCDPSCALCYGPGPNQCWRCSSGRRPLNGICVLDCDSSCLTCSQTNLDYCLSCDSNKTLANGKCINYTCDETCLTCDGPDSDECLTCDPDRILINGKCLRYSCDSSCSTCSGPKANQCLSCPSGRVLNGSGHCIPYTCDPSCLTCFGPESNQCLTCGPNRTWDYGDCVPYTCDLSCLTCSGPGKNQCLTCDSGRILRGTQCETYSCDSSCLTCSGPDNDDCLTCSSDRILTADGECQIYSCDESCSTCSGPNPDQCESCSNDRILNGTECVAETCDPSCSTCSGPDSHQCLSCPSEKFLTESHQCISCDSSCLTCFGPSSIQCSSCSSDKTLFSNGTCLIPQQPEVCYNTCSSCTGPLESQCITCEANLTFFNGYCYQECPTGYDAVQVNVSLLCQQQEVDLDVQANYISDFDNQVILTFDKNIESLSSEILSNLNVSMVFQADQAPIGYNYSITPKDQQILISMNFDGPLIPNNKLEISLADQIQTNLSTYLLKNGKLSINLPEYYPYSQSQIEMIKNTAQVSSTSGKANSIYSMGSSFLFKSLHSMRSELIDCMINYFIFMNINLPPNFIAYAKQNIGQPGGFLPNIFTLILPKEETQQNASSGSVLDQYAAANMTFLRRYGSKLTYFMLILGIIICLEYLFKFFSKKLASSHPVIKILAYLSCSLRWNFLISEVIADFQESTFSAIYGVSIADNQIDRFASVFGILFTLGSIIIVYYLAKKIFISSHLKIFTSDVASSENEKNELARYDALHKSIKANKFPNLLFFCFLLTRSFGFSLVLVLASNTPILQLAYLLMCSLGMITYLLIYDPIKRRSQFFLTTGYELLLLICIGLAITIYVYSKININAVEIRSNLGFAIMFISMGMIVMNILSFLVELNELRELLKKRKQARGVSKIYPTETGSLNNNSTLILSNILPSRSSLIFSKAPLTKSPSQRSLARNRLVRTMFKINVGQASDETALGDNNISPEKVNDLEEVEKELKSKGELKLMIKRNYQAMNMVTAKAIHEEEQREDSMKDQEVSIHVQGDDEIEKEFNMSERAKQNTIRGEIYSRNNVNSSMNEIPSVGSMILDSIRPEKKARVTRLLRIQDRYNSKVLSKVMKTLPDIDEI